jgi:hypothetical protein
MFSKRALVSIVSFALFLIPASGQAGQSQAGQGAEHGSMSMPAAKLAAGPLKITFGDKSAEWTPEKLAALPQKTITVHNEHTKADETYSGVALIDLLTPLGVHDKPRGKDFRLYLLAAGSDGYEVVYSIGEITPDVSNATVIVADMENGKVLADDGPLKLIATEEKRPARWVRNLVAIRVMAAE